MRTSQLSDDPVTAGEQATGVENGEESAYRLRGGTSTKREESDWTAIREKKNPLTFR